MYWNMTTLNLSQFTVELHSKYWYVYFCISCWDLLALRFSENVSHWMAVPKYRGKCESATISLHRGNSLSLTCIVGVPIAAWSLRAQPEVAEILMSTESPYFSHYNPKITASNSLYFERYSGKCSEYWYPNFDFPTCLHNSLIPSVTYIFFPRRESKKQTSGETSQIVSFRSKSISWMKVKHTLGKMGKFWAPSQNHQHLFEKIIFFLS